MGFGREAEPLQLDFFETRMLNRKDYIFAIGYDGSRAIVDRRSKSNFGKLSARKLADKGLFRAAYLAAVYDADSIAAEYVLEKFNSASPHKCRAELDKVLGIHPPSEDITGARTV